MSRDILLDTHTLIWVLQGSDQLQHAKLHIAKARTVYASMVSWWEISIKATLGKLDVDPEQSWREAKLAGIHILPIEIAHCQMLLTLPMIHRDPFDRMLVAQSLSEDLPLLTHDITVAQYSDKIILF